MSAWICIDAEPQPDGIVGGDGACESVSVRFHHVTEPAMVTVYLYTVDREERGWSADEEFPFDVEEMVTFSTLSTRDGFEDPGAFEVDSSTVYEHPSPVGFRDEISADDKRDAVALDWIDSGASHYIAWDGINL